MKCLIYINLRIFRQNRCPRALWKRDIDILRGLYLSYYDNVLLKKEQRTPCGMRRETSSISLNSDNIVVFI